MYQKEIKELREAKLKEYKVNRLAELEDREATIEQAYLKEMEKMRTMKKEIEDMAFIPVNEGCTRTYNY